MPSGTSAPPNDRPGSLLPGGLARGLEGAPEWVRRRSGTAPALLFDVLAARLVGANAGGRRFWWGAQAAGEFPHALDSAMPALQVLREMPASCGRNAPLLYWTARGLATCASDWAYLTDAPHLVALTLHDPACAAAEPQAAVAPADMLQPLAAKLAHELRTPIGAVMAYAEILAREHFGPLSNPRYRDYARNILASATHALGVIDRMSAAPADKPESIRRELRFCDLDPAAIVESCMTVIRPLAARAHVRLDVAFPARLPRIVADEVTVRQMLLNLLTNAVKFARPGDRVTLLVVQEGDGGLTFTVEDTGPGLEATTAQGNEGRFAKGLGLGLPLTRELAEANGAAFAIKSAPGAGTRASISFGRGRVVPV